MFMVHPVAWAQWWWWYLVLATNAVVSLLSLKDNDASALRLARQERGWRHVLIGSVVSRIEAGKSFATEGRPARDGEIGVVKVSAMTWGSFGLTKTRKTLCAIFAGEAAEHRT